MLGNVVVVVVHPTHQHGAVDLAGQLPDVGRDVADREADAPVVGPVGGEPCTIRTWCSDISPARSTMSTPRASSTSTSISWPRERRLSAAKVSRWASCSPWDPGTIRIAPFSTVASVKATHAVTTSGSLSPQ